MNKSYVYLRWNNAMYWVWRASHWSPSLSLFFIYSSLSLFFLSLFTFTFHLVFPRWNNWLACHTICSSPNNCSLSLFICLFTFVIFSSHISQVEQLTGLPCLSALHLAHNNLKQLPDLHTRLGQVGRRSVNTKRKWKRQKITVPWPGNKALPREEAFWKV